MLARFLRLAVILAFPIAAVWSGYGLADVPPAAAKSPTPLTDAQQAAALAFAQEHHPQLSTLIRRLEKRDALEYQQALADVSKISERLARLQQRDPERYNVELALWKVDSRIRLLAARMANDERASLEHQIRSLLNDRTDLRLQQLALERKRLSDRIDRLDDQAAQLSSDRDVRIDRELERLRKSVRNRTSTVGRRQPANRSEKGQQTPPDQTVNSTAKSPPTTAPKSN